MSTITNGSAPRLQQLGIESIFGNAYSKHPQAHLKYFDQRTSSKSFEVLTMIENTKSAVKKDEADSITFDTIGQGMTPKFVHETIGLGLRFSEESLEDDLYNVLSRGATMIGDSVRDKESTDAANILNNAFDTGKTMAGGDGLNLCSTAHVFGPNGSGTFSNRLTTDADLSEASLESLMIQIANAQDNRGKFIRLGAEKLVIAPANMFNAHRILKSTLRSSTAENDANAIRDMGLLSGETCVDQYLSDADAWFLTTDADDGLIAFTRRGERFLEDDGFESGVKKMKGDKRISFGWGEPRGVYGTQGAQKSLGTHHVKQASLN